MDKYISVLKNYLLTIVLVCRITRGIRQINLFGKPHPSTNLSDTYVQPQRRITTRALRHNACHYSGTASILGKRPRTCQIRTQRILTFILHIRIHISLRLQSCHITEFTLGRHQFRYVYCNRRKISKRTTLKRNSNNSYAFVLQTLSTDANVFIVHSTRAVDQLSNAFLENFSTFCL